MKKTTAWVAIALMMAGCSSNGNDNDQRFVVCPVDHEIQLTRVVTGNNDFAFNLMRKVADEKKSQIVSPISITYALGMLNNGATGETRQQINRVLGFNDVSETNDFCRKMLTIAPHLDSLTKVLIANTVYMNKDYMLKPAFVQTAHSYYQADPETRDFHDGQTMDVINQWASDHTERMIEKVLDSDSFDPDAVSYLLNAIYFKGVWKMKFDEKETYQEPFNHAKEVSMMHQQSEFPYADTDDYQALQLPYGNGSYIMTILLPHVDKSVNDVLQGLTAEKWKNLWSAGGGSKQTLVDVHLPSFETNTDINLIKLMSQLGMPNAFNRQLAEFPDFCNVPTFIGLMKQVARIKLSEEGTEAAAVSQEVNRLKKKRNLLGSAFTLISNFYSSTEKSSLPTPQMGHTQSSGMSSKAVPGAMPLSGSPTSGSYT